MSETYLVRRAHALVAVLELNREADRVSYTVSAPRRADARLDRSQTLAVGVSRLEAGRDELSPDAEQNETRQNEGSSQQETFVY